MNGPKCNVGFGRGACQKSTFCSGGGGSPNLHPGMPMRAVAFALPHPDCSLTNPGPPSSHAANANIHKSAFEPFLSRMRCFRAFTCLLCFRNSFASTQDVHGRWQASEEPQRVQCDPWGSSAVGAVATGAAFSLVEIGGAAAILAQDGIAFACSSV